MRDLVCDHRNLEVCGLAEDEGGLVTERDEGFGNDLVLAEEFGIAGQCQRHGMSLNALRSLAFTAVVLGEIADEEAAEDADKRPRMVS
ncbi:MAG: hypothetical protein K8U57_28420 [Planctomycetes bacterium]|nr:hypothetical protein [Planctomycetota bacterium]